MIRFRLIAAVWAVAWCVPGCAPSEPELPHLRIRVAPTPPPVGEARVIVQMPDGVVGEYEVSVTARPIDQDHGPSRSAEPVGPNVYAVAEFPLEKSGDWRIVARATPRGGGAVLQDSTTVRVIGGAS